MTPAEIQLTYTTAGHIPAQGRLMSPTGVIHVRSRFTRHWDGIGTPMCNDGRQLPVASGDTDHCYLCRRCLVLERNERMSAGGTR